MIPPEVESLVETFIEVCRRIESKGFVTATDGNVSARLPNGNILSTPAAMNKGFVQAGDLVEVTPSGAVVAGKRKPSSELDMHLFIYETRPDVKAVVHCHPVYATAFAAARIPLAECVFPEVIVGLGAIPLAQYATPSTKEVRHSIEPFVPSADAILLANHGVVTYGGDLWDAYFKMEKVEHAAHIQFAARMLGGEKILSADDIAKLRRISAASYGKDFSAKPACEPAPPSADMPMTEEELRSIIGEVRRRLGRTVQ
ncbi:MAG TPA: class II aldolase/adducin family protein [Bacteroidota bacterium]|nr:class II aldolase/adducin family protein [Bacteroidota bacterium]